MANDIYKNIKSRHKLKNGTEAEWNLTNIFIPLKGEPIIYNPDETYLNYRYKIGDGVTDVKELPFADKTSVGIKTFSTGTNNVAGTRCFTVTAVTANENKQVILTLDSVQDLAVSQECRFKLDAEYYATILGIDGNNVQLDILSTDLYILEIYSPDIENGEYSDENNPYLVRQSDGTDTEKNTLFIIGHPEIGTDRIIGTNSTAFGSGNNASVLNSFASGTNNITVGAYSAAFGANNISPYGSIVAGKNNDARLGDYGAIFGTGNKFTKISRCSFVAGSNNTLGANYTTSFGGSNKSLGIGSTTFGLANEALSNYSTAIGYYTKTTGNYQLAVGSGNNPLSDAVFMIGNGSKNSNGEMVRSNAFVVKYNGNTVIPLGDLEVTKGSATIGNKLNVNTILAKVYSGTNNGVVLNTQNNKATGNYSIAGGSSCSATALCSTALGAQTNANHVGSFIAGGVNTSTCDYQTIFGKHADTSKNSLFMIGFGTANAKKNVFEVSNTGKAYLGNADIDTTNDASIVTKKYVDDLHLVKAEGENAIQQILDADSYSWKPNNSYVQLLLVDKNLIALDENGKVANIGASGDFSSVFGGKGLAIGKRSSARGSCSIAYGKNSIADGDNVLAYGEASQAICGKTTAKGNYSFASGLGAVAEGPASDAGGTECIAKGHSSFARGNLNQAIGMFSSVFGSENIANQSCQFVIGKHNNNKSNTLFEIGNGTDQNNKSNGFEVYLDGHAEVQTQGTSDNSVITKKYVNDNFANVESGTWTPYVEEVAEGLEISFSNSTYYRIGRKVDITTNMTINYTNLSADDNTLMFKYGFVYGLPYMSSIKTTNIFDINSRLMSIRVHSNANSFSIAPILTVGTTEPLTFNQFKKYILYKIVGNNSTGTVTFTIFATCYI